MTHRIFLQNQGHLLPFAQQRAIGRDALNLRGDPGQKVGGSARGK